MPAPPKVVLPVNTTAPFKVAALATSAFTNAPTPKAPVPERLNGLLITLPFRSTVPPSTETVPVPKGPDVTVPVELEPAINVPAKTAVFP